LLKLRRFKNEPPELRAILDRARTVNTQLDISGILLHTEGSYFQVLEGDAEAIDSLYAKIARQAAHKCRINRPRADRLSSVCRLVHGVRVGDIQGRGGNHRR
jgi:hypothetical protein